MFLVDQWIIIFIIVNVFPLCISYLWLDTNHCEFYLVFVPINILELCLEYSWIGINVILPDLFSGIRVGYNIELIPSFHTKKTRPFLVFLSISPELWSVSTLIIAGRHYSWFCMNFGHLFSSSFWVVLFYPRVIFLHNCAHQFSVESSEELSEDWWVLFIHLCCVWHSVLWLHCFVFSQLQFYLLNSGRWLGFPCIALQSENFLQTASWNNHRSHTCLFQNFSEIIVPSFWHWWRVQLFHILHFFFFLVFRAWKQFHFATVYYLN